MKPLNYFARNDEGAVTVDFVVLTGLVIGLCLLVAIPMFGGVIGWGQLIAGLVNRTP